MRRAGGGAALLLAGLALAVLHPPLARSRALSSPAHRAATYLQHAVNADGGLGAAPGEPSAQLFAGWAALGLASAGVDIATLRRSSGDATLEAYVRSGQGASDTGSLERTILVLHAAGAPVGGLEARLVARVSARGSVAGQVNLSAFALLALRAGGGSQTTAVQARLRGWLAGEADSDGGYGFDGSGSSSDADDTGAVLEALGSADGAAVVRARRRAIAYLRGDEDVDGGFPDAPGAGSNAQSTAWAIQGLIAAGVAPGSLQRAGHTPLGYLDSLVAADGAVSYARGQSQTPVWVTGEALMALTGSPLPLAAPSAGAVTSEPAHVAHPAHFGTPVRSRRRTRHPRPRRHRAAAPASGMGEAVARAVVRMQSVVGGLPARVIAGARLGG